MDNTDVANMRIFSYDQILWNWECLTAFCTYLSEKAFLFWELTINRELIH